MKETAIHINATIADRISQYVSKPYIIKTYEVYAESESKEELISLFQKCINFVIEDNMIIFTLKRDEVNIKDQLDSHTKMSYCVLQQLKKNYADERYTDMMIKYLQHNKLDHVLKEIQDTSNECRKR